MRYDDDWLGIDTSHIDTSQQPDLATAPSPEITRCYTATLRNKQLTALCDQRRIFTLGWPLAEGPVTLSARKADIVADLNKFTTTTLYTADSPADALAIINALLSAVHRDEEQQRLRWQEVPPFVACDNGKWLSVTDANGRTLFATRPAKDDARLLRCEDNRVMLSTEYGEAKVMYVAASADHALQILTVWSQGVLRLTRTRCPTRKPWVNAALILLLSLGSGVAAGMWLITPSTSEHTTAERYSGYTDNMVSDEPTAVLPAQEYRPTAPVQSSHLPAPLTSSQPQPVARLPHPVSTTPVHPLKRNYTAKD